MLSLSSSNRYFQRKAKRPLPTQFLTFQPPRAAPKSRPAGRDPKALGWTPPDGIDVPYWGC